MKPKVLVRKSAAGELRNKIDELDSEFSIEAIQYAFITLAIFNLGIISSSRTRSHLKILPLARRYPFLSAYYFCQIEIQSASLLTASLCLLPQSLPPLIILTLFFAACPPFQSLHTHTH